VFGRRFAFPPREDLLTFEELTRLTRVFAGPGVRKARTGGEPLFRPGLEHLIAQLATIDGIQGTALTANGALLARQAQTLAAAGLRRVTVSLDSLDDTVFMALNDAASRSRRGWTGSPRPPPRGWGRSRSTWWSSAACNDLSVLPLAAHFRGSEHVLRLIEYLDVGTANGWRLDDVVPAAETIALIGRQWPLEPLPASYPGEVAARCRYQDGAGELGIIALVTQPFRRRCTRARLSAEGELYTCLFAGSGHDLRAAVRNGVSDQVLREQITAIWAVRTRSLL
jgi:GTP 3',8-cyclase